MRWEQGLTAVEREEVFRGNGSVIVELAAQWYAFTKTLWTEHLERVHFIVCELPCNKTEKCITLFIYGANLYIIHRKTAYFTMDQWFPINILKIEDTLWRQSKDLPLLFGLWLTWHGRKETGWLVCCMTGSSRLPCAGQLSETPGDWLISHTQEGSR